MQIGQYACIKVCILHLTVEYCRQFHVELVPEKKKLLAFTPSNEDLQVYLQKLVNHLSLSWHSPKKLNTLESSDPHKEICPISWIGYLLATEQLWLYCPPEWHPLTLVTLLPACKLKDYSDLLFYFLGSVHWLLKTQNLESFTTSIK